jgi:hypothetical protein
VHGSVPVVGGTVFAAAGWHTGLDGGITLTAIRLTDGAVLWRKRIEKLPGVRYKGDYPVALLTSDGKSVYIETHGFDVAGGETRPFRYGAVLRFGRSGFRDDDWVQFSNTKRRMRWIDAHCSGELVSSGRTFSIGVDALRPKDDRGYGPKSGMGHYRLFRQKARREPPEWSVVVPLKMRALVLAGKTAFVAGRIDPPIPDLIEAAGERARSRVANALGDEKLLPQRAELWAMSAADGKKLASMQLDAAPVFDGFAVANGRLYLSTLDGRLRCFGPGKGPGQP